MSSPDHTADSEAVLLRLFKLLSISEQENVFALVLEQLGKRCSFNPHFKSLLPNQIEEETSDSDIDDRIFAAWPGSWPGQEIVELDNVGDPSEWLRTLFCRIP